MQLFPAIESTLLQRLVNQVSGSRGGWQRHRAASAMASTILADRQRDLVPLPHVPESMKPASLIPWRWRILQGFCNCMIDALNYLYRTPTTTKISSIATLQVDALQRLVDRALDFYHRLIKAGDSGWQHLLPMWVTGVDRPEGPRVVANQLGSSPYANLASFTPSAPLYLELAQPWVSGSAAFVSRRLVGAIRVVRKTV